MSLEFNKALIRRYYDDLWNKWDLSVADEILSPDISFRGSLRVSVQGMEGFKQYVTMVRSAFPDFHNSVEDLIAERDTVVARLTYRGTHRGELFSIAPTGNRVTYAGIAIFKIADPGFGTSGCSATRKACAANSTASLVRWPNRTISRPIGSS